MLVRRVAEESGPAEEGLGRLLLRTVRGVRTRFDRNLEALGITAPQAELLFLCAHEGAVTPKDLSELLATDNAGVTRLVDRLEAKGLVKRTTSAYDRRSVTLRLTPAGRALVPRVRRAAEAQKRRVFHGFSASDQARLRSLLERVLANVGGSA